MLQNVEKAYLNRGGNTTFLLSLATSFYCSCLGRAAHVEFHQVTREHNRSGSNVELLHGYLSADGTTAGPVRGVLNY